MFGGLYCCADEHNLPYSKHPVSFYADAVYLRQYVGSEVMLADRRSLTAQTWLSLIVFRECSDMPLSDRRSPTVQTCLSLSLCLSPVSAMCLCSMTGG
jgi:hypothetical protein